MILRITANDIAKEKGAFETCEYADTIFNVLYDSKTQEKISKEAFLETLPVPLQIAVVLNTFLGPDSFQEAIQHITIEEEDPGTALFYQDKIVWALHEIGRKEFALLVKDAINQYEQNHTLNDETKKELSEIDPHDDDISNSLASYIKKHAEEIVTKEYIEKSEQLAKGPAKNTGKYLKKVDTEYPWFKI